jgi:formylglycine-generating enzyme required for sulfatase activity
MKTKHSLLVVVSVLLVATFLYLPAPCRAQWEEDYQEQEEQAPAEPVIERIRLQPGTNFTNSLGMPFVYIKPGKFDMGEPPRWGHPIPYSNATWPIREVTVRRGFWMSRGEVSQKHFETIMGYNRSKFRNPEKPVERVKWTECQDFCELLTEREEAHLSFAYQRGLKGYRYALPSEAQWEYACRAGSDGSYYGPNVHELAWNFFNSKGETHLGGELKPNAWGLYDMLGNVAEWCQDRMHSNYVGAPEDERPWEKGTNPNRVVRGGAYDTREAKDLRCGARSFAGPAYQRTNVGFRIVLIPEYE